MKKLLTSIIERLINFFDLLHQNRIKNFYEAYGNIGNSYQKKKDYERAEFYFFKVVLV